MWNCRTCTVCVMNTAGVCIMIMIMDHDHDHDHDHDLIFTFICVRTAAAVFLYIVIARTAVNLYWWLIKILSPPSYASIIVSLEMKWKLTVVLVVLAMTIFHQDISSLDATIIYVAVVCCFSQVNAQRWWAAATQTSCLLAATWLQRHGQSLDCKKLMLMSPQGIFDACDDGWLITLFNIRFGEGIAGSRSCWRRIVVNWLLL